MVDRSVRALRVRSRNGLLGTVMASLICCGRPEGPNGAQTAALQTFIVASRVDPALDSVHVDYPASTAKAKQFRDRATWARDGVLAIERESVGETRQLHIEFLLEFRPPDPPQVSVGAFVGARHSGTPHVDIGGTVTVNSSVGDPSRWPRGTLMMIYDFEGPCAGSPVRRVGGVEVRASDVAR